MSGWQNQIDHLIAPALQRSQATDLVRIAPGALADVGPVAASMAPGSSRRRKALIMADEAGFGAAGMATRDSLSAAGFTCAAHILPVAPLPQASVEEAEPFRAALAEDPDLFPVSVGSGVINDLVKYAALRTDRRYITLATAASMDGYTSAGAPLAKDGFKITIPTRAPIAMIADLNVIATAPAEMNGWGYGDLAGKTAAGGDWILADAVGAEPIDSVAWPLVQDHLDGWLSEPQGIATGARDSVARLFVGLTAVGFAMEFHQSSRPASGAEHQIAHLWEMEHHSHLGRKVSHGAAVSVGCTASLALFDWLIAQDLTALDPDALARSAPDLPARLSMVDRDIPNDRIAGHAADEVRAKHPDPAVLHDRMHRLRDTWPTLRDRLQRHLPRQAEMVAMLRAAGAPALAADIGISGDRLARTIRAAAHIRRRYTVLDLLLETGLFEDALQAVMPRLAGSEEKKVAL